MGLSQGRGGVPHVFREGITTTVRKHQLPSTCSYLKIRVATNPCKIFFTEDDATNNVNYVLVPIPAAETPHGEWDGPVEANTVWLQGSGGTSAVELVTFQRRA